MWDVQTVCTHGLFIPNNVVYALGKHFTTKAEQETRLFVDDPSFVAGIVNLQTLDVNETGDPSPTHHQV